jgi:hypothetical protein
VRVEDADQLGFWNVEAQRPQRYLQLVVVDERVLVEIEEAEL